MNPIRKSLVWLTLLSALLASCTFPQGEARGTTPDSTPLQAGQARLVFQIAQARTMARALVDAGYLTLEMRSVVDGTLKADDATREADGSYLVDIEGIVAGDWRLKVRLYADIDSPALLYYADLTHHVGVGVPTSIDLRVYEPSSLAGGTISLADKVEYLEVEGRGQVWGTSLNPSVTALTQTFRPGEVVQLHSIPMTVPYDEDVNPGMDADAIREPLFDEQWFNYDEDGNTLDEPIENDETWDEFWDDNDDQGIWARPATDQRVTYTSDDPEVVDISSTGRLKARGVGETTIQITTVEGRKTARIPVRVEESVVGIWEYGAPLSRVLKVERSETGVLWATLLTDLQTGGAEVEVKRGMVTRQLDGSYKASLNLRLGFPSVDMISDRTQRSFLYNLTPTNLTFMEQGGGDLAVQVGNAISTTSYSRQTNYVPINRFQNLDSTAFVELNTVDGWGVDEARWVLENDSAGEPATYRQLYWWVEDTDVASADTKTGSLTLLGPGATFIHAQSLDKPDLPILSWELTVEEVAPAYSLANLDIDIPLGYTDDQDPAEYQKLDVKIQVAHDPSVYRSLELQRWTGSAWASLVTISIDGLNVSDWFSTYIDTTFSTEQRYRVITKGNPANYLRDSDPSPVLVAMSPDLNGNPVAWPGQNLSPDGVTTVYNDGVDYTVPSYFDGTETYLSRWFLNNTGTTWDPDLMYSLRWGTRTWWIYSDNVSGSAPGAYVVGRDRLGNQIGGALWRNVPQIHGMGIPSNGDANLLGVGSSSGTIYWNPEMRHYQDGVYVPN